MATHRGTSARDRCAWAAGFENLSVGYLAAARIPRFIEALQVGLRERGYVEGRNLKIEYRFGGETFGVLAAELVALGPDAIVTNGTPPASETSYHYDSDRDGGR